MRTQEWTVEIHLDEDDDTTHAKAVLRSRDGRLLSARGTARRNPDDAPVPEIGEEIAAARALMVLGDQLMDVAEKDVENLSHPIAR
jgi:hypothetical protein